MGQVRLNIKKDLLFWWENDCFKGRSVSRFERIKQHLDAWLENERGYPLA